MPIALFIYLFIAIVVFIWFATDYRVNATRLAIFWPLYVVRWLVTNTIAAAAGAK
jgi:hypothetical protein